MFCFRCQGATQVSNSRPHKKTPQVWRRRNCTECGSTFTTYERINLIDELQIQTVNGSIKYNPGELLQSLIECFAHKSVVSSDAYWLMRSIEDGLAAHDLPVISEAAYQKRIYTTLHNFDELAGIQYAARHGLRTLLR